MYIAFPLFQVLPAWVGRAIVGAQEDLRDEFRAREGEDPIDRDAERDALFVNVWALVPPDGDGSAR